MLCHCLYYQIFVVSRISFEKKPRLFVVYLDVYMDVVFLIDMIRNFTEPFMHKGKLETRVKQIAKNYLFGWFIMDLYAFFPLAYFRYISKWEEGGKDNVKNLMELNFERLPRFYKIMLLMQMTRARDTKRFFEFWLKNRDIRIEV